MAKKKKTTGREVEKSTKKAPAESVGERRRDASETKPGHLDTIDVTGLWRAGDWRRLAAAAPADIADRKDRGLAALLVGYALQQLGFFTKAAEYVRLAIDWGCPPKTLSRVLLAGAHNTLGNIHAANRKDEEADRHFALSVDVDFVDRTEQKRISGLRRTGEMARLGLFTDAADKLGKEIESHGATGSGDPRQDHRFEILRAEIELLTHELSIALERRQIQARGDDSDTSVKAAAARKSVSQLGQDLWVLERTGYKRGGFFVEVGATNGVLLSNTWLLEREFGWQGICVEPNPSFLKELRVNRSCRTVGDCVGAVTGEDVEFILADVYGGIAHYAGEDSHKGKRDAYRAAGEVIRMTTVSLNDLLIKYGAPRRIDYLSIDTEGNEFPILNAFPFDRWDIPLLTVEHNFTPRRKDIRDLLEGHGYVCREREWDDWYFRDVDSSMKS